MHSPWPKRLLGIEPWQRPVRDEVEILREYNDGWFKQCLELWDTYSADLDPAKAGADSAIRFFHQVTKQTASEVETNKALYQCRPDASLFNVGDQLMVGDLVLASMINLDMIVRYVDKALAKWPVKTVVEAGCGTGVNLFHIYARLDIDLIVGGDISTNAVTLANRISQKLSIPGSFMQFDFKDRASMRSLTDRLDEYLLFTCHAIEQIPVDSTARIIENVLSLPCPPSVVIHFEPIVEEGDQTVMGAFCKRYAEKNNYNASLLQALTEYERDKRLEILEFQKRFFGVNPFHALSMVSWCRR